VVQSWLAEWTYGVAERAGGLRWVMLEQGILTGLLAYLVARLARAGTPYRTAAAGVMALGSGVALWSGRPLLFGLICLALVVTIVEENWPLWLLVPVAWLWVNTHGSFLLGVLWLWAVAVGEGMDVRSMRVVFSQLRPLVWFIGGLLVGGINPLGPKLLLFPLTVVDRSEVFRRVVEWRSPDFQSAQGLFTLAFLALSLIVLIKSRTRWRDVLPVVGFLVLGLIAVRNLTAMSIVLAPALGRTLRALPGTAQYEPRPVSRVFLGAVVVLAVLFAVTAGRQDPLDLSSYPEKAIVALQQEGYLPAGHRVAVQDFVGNYLELKYGTDTQVFIDDRVDMFPKDVSNDYHDLLVGTPGALSILDRRNIDVVLWRNDRPLAAMLDLSGHWRQHYRDKQWVAYVRSPVPEPR
jgi:hypothetical protein